MRITRGDDEHGTYWATVRWIGVMTNKCFAYPSPSSIAQWLNEQGLSIEGAEFEQYKKGEYNDTAKRQHGNNRKINDDSVGGIFNHSAC